MRKIGTRAKWWILVVTALAALGFGVPAVVSAISTGGATFEFYVEALKWGYKGLKEYFQFIIDLYKLSLSI